MTKVSDAKGTIGSSFDDFLHEERTFDEVQAGALKKVIAHELQTEITPHENQPQPTRPLA